MKTLLLMFLLATPALAQAPLRVYVGSARSVDGFVEGGRLEESAKDLRAVLQDKEHRKYIQLVDYKESAEYVLEVTFSGNVSSGSTTDFRRGIFGGLVAVNTPNSLPALAVTLHIAGKDYTKDFSHAQQLFWKDLAKRVVNQFDQWLVANAATIREGRR